MKPAVCSTTYQDSLTEDAFFAMEVKECERMDRKSTSPVVLTLPDSDDDDADFEQPLQRSATKSRLSSADRKSSQTTLRDDRASMSRPSRSSRRRTSSRLTPDASAKRKLDFESKSRLKYASDNSELSGTDEDDCDYVASRQTQRPTSDSSEDEHIRVSPKKRRPRDSIMSIITPSNRADTPRNRGARSVLPRTPRRKPINFDFDGSSNDENELVEEEDVPLSKLRRKPNGRRTSPKATKRSFVDLVSSPGGSFRTSVDSPGIVEVKSSLYPLPVITPSPVVKKRNIIVGGSSQKRRRIRKIVDSEDEDEQSEIQDEIPQQTAIVCDRPPRPIVVAEPSESVRKLKDGGSSLPEWYQERSIDEFSDSDAFETIPAAVQKMKSKVLKPVSASASLTIVTKDTVSPCSLSPKNVTKSTKPRKRRSFANIGESIFQAKNDSTTQNCVSTSKLSAVGRSSQDSGKSRRQTSVPVVSSDKSQSPKKQAPVRLSVFGSLSENSQSPRKRTKTLHPFFTKKIKSKARPSQSSAGDSVVVYSDDEDLEFPASRPHSKDSIEMVGFSEDEMDVIEDASKGDSASMEVEDVGPPPFRLEIMCENGESIMEMIQRVGENVVLDKIMEAQSTGRSVIGAEELGISSAPPKTSPGVRKFKEVVQPAGRSTRKNAYDPEKAMNGEYTFNYRGKNEEGGKRGKSNWRGRGRYRGRGRRGKGRRS